MDIGRKGLAEANLIMPQSASFAFAVVHKDAAGHVVDHSTSTIRMALQSKDGTRTYDMSEYCTGDDESITVSIPPEATAAVPKGKMVWDMFAEMESGASLRLVYGNASVVDTYALDGE